MIFIVFLLISFLGAVEYSYIPKTLYQNQVFPITIKTKKVIKSFSFNGGIPTLPKEPLIVQDGSNIFYTFYFKAKGKELKTPAIFIDGKRLAPKKIKVKELPKKLNFCGVLATDMQISLQEVTPYDDFNSLMVFRVKANDANIEDMSLLGDSQIDILQQEFTKSEALFYLIIPTKMKKISILYYNTIQNRFMPLKIETSFSKEDNINPQEIGFEDLKQKTIIALTLFFIFMGLLKRDRLYLSVGVILIFTLFYLFAPNEKIEISKSTPIYILPTQTSTIALKTDKKAISQILAQYKDFYKISYNNKIGWIKSDKKN